MATSGQAEPGATILGDDRGDAAFDVGDRAGALVLHGGGQDDVGVGERRVRRVR